MKILVFTSLYPNNVQPTHGVFVKERLTAVSRLPGCQVTVVAPVPYFPPLPVGRWFSYSQVARKEVIEGVEVHHPRYFLIPKVAMALHGLLMYLSLRSFVRELHRERRFDLVDAHYVYPDGFAAVRLAGLLGLRVVVTARGSDIHRFTEFPLIRRLVLGTLQRADRAIAVSASLKEAMMRLGLPETKIAVVPNGVDTEKFHPMSRAEARSRLGLENGKLILSVGHLVPLKGFDLLIRSFAALVEQKEHRDSRLVIVGEGPERPRLEKLVASLGLSDRVRLVGAVAHRDLRPWYSAADAFCLASSREGWPNVLLESMACGTPVVATAVGGAPEIVASDRLGLLAERSEPPLARALDRALSEVWDHRLIAGHARARSWEAVAAGVVEVFRPILQATERAPSKTGGETPG